MSEIKDGGPAFPVPGLMEDPSFNGMSLRDYFAAKAMQGFIIARASAFDGSPEEFDDRIGRWAYETADAMLCARG